MAIAKATRIPVEVLTSEPPEPESDQGFPRAVSFLTGSPDLAALETTFTASLTKANELRHLAPFIEEAGRLKPLLETVRRMAPLVERFASVQAQMEAITKVSPQLIEILKRFEGMSQREIEQDIIERQASSFRLATEAVTPLPSTDRIPLGALASFQGQLDMLRTELRALRERPRLAATKRKKKGPRSA